jgi:hypothetical protein
LFLANYLDFRREAMHLDSLPMARGLALSAAIAVLSLAATTHASAQCIDPPQRGNWVNVDPNTRSITRATIEFTCIDVVLAGQPVPPSWHATLFGKCHPTDCPWGRVPGRDGAGGSITATYDQGFATRAVRITRVGARLNIRVATNFRDPGRRDYVTNDRMRRAP